MYLCMYACMYVCIYVFMYAYTYVCMYYALKCSQAYSDHIKLVNGLSITVLSDISNHDHE